MLTKQQIIDEGWKIAWEGINEKDEINYGHANFWKPRTIKDDWETENNCSKGWTIKYNRNPKIKMAIHEHFYYENADDIDEKETSRCLFWGICDSIDTFRLICDSILVEKRYEGLNKSLADFKERWGKK